MPQTAAQKLRIKPGMHLLAFHAPEDFLTQLQPLPEGVVLSTQAKEPGQVHWFVKTAAQVASEAAAVLSRIHHDTVCWIYFPKGSSGIQTDLTRDKGWAPLLNEDFQFLSLVSFNPTWSAFGLRRKQNGATSPAKPSRAATYAAYYDARTKTVNLPTDMAKALSKNKEAALFFDSLSFSHKREYIEWVVSAKKEATRIKRISDLLLLLKQGKKNK